MNSYNKNLNILFIPGILISTIGLFLPLIADKGIMFIKDFNFFWYTTFIYFYYTNSNQFLLNFTKKKKIIALNIFYSTIFRAFLTFS